MEATEKISKFEQSGMYNAKSNDVITVVPYSLIGNVTTALLLKVTKPRGLSNDDTIKFFHTWCSKCHDKKENGNIDHQGTMQMMQNVSNAVIMSPFLEVETQCKICRDKSLIFVLHNITAKEQKELIDNSILSVAKEYGAIKGIGKNDSQLYSIISYILLACLAFCMIYAFLDLFIWKS